MSLFLLIKEDLHFTICEYLPGNGVFSANIKTGLDIKIVDLKISRQTSIQQAKWLR